jgi:integrative and conjugative element protein (TIGR02256 family)
MCEYTTTTIWLPEKAYICLLEEAIQKMPRETGGILIGYWGTKYEAVITAIVGPGSKAAHNRHSFSPDNEFHTQEITRLYAQSGRTETYLGDWHTHPSAGAYMSSRDQETLRILADYKQARLAQPLMMILGTRPFGLQAWMQSYKRVLFSNRSIYSPCEIKLF